MTRVLIVEDEESFADPLAFLLRKEGFTTAVAITGQQALEEFDRNGADIVLLDLMLPGMSGTDVCRQLRTRSAVPVIMVTARDGEIDKVVGLELGADDYITKPFSTAELVSRLRAILRRREFDRSDGTARFELGALSIDSAEQSVRLHGEEVHLTPMEFRILTLLARDPGRVFERNEILRGVWQTSFVGDERACDSHIFNLRAKIEDDPREPRRLLTVPGAGYKLVAS